MVARASAELGHHHLIFPFVAVSAESKVVKHDDVPAKTMFHPASSSHPVAKRCELLSHEMLTDAFDMRHHDRSQDKSQKSLLNRQFMPNLDTRLSLDVSDI